MNYSSFISIFEEIYSDKKSFIVIDEFQRLDEKFYDYLHFSSSKIKCRLFLIGSSFRFINKILKDNSPIPGLFQTYRRELIKYEDIYNFFKRKRNLLIPILFFREPWLLEFYKGDEFSTLIYSLKNVKGLVGEIFFGRRKGINSNL